MTVIRKRGFKCPETGEPCTHGECKLPSTCVEKLNNRPQTEAEIKEVARQHRIKIGKFGPEDIGL